MSKSKINAEVRNRLVRRWVREHGAASFDFKNKDVVFHDGGLFCIQSKKIKMSKIKLDKSNKFESTSFSLTKKKYPQKIFEARMWFKDIDDNIEYFQSLKNLLNELGYETKPDYKT